MKNLTHKQHPQWMFHTQWNIQK